MTAGSRATPHSTRLALTLSYVATSIPHFVSFEVRTADAFCRLGFLATLWQSALIAVLRMESGYLRGPGNRWRHETTGQRQ